MWKKTINLYYISRRRNLEHFRFFLFCSNTLHIHIEIYFMECRSWRYHFCIAFLDNFGLYGHFLVIECIFVLPERILCIVKSNFGNFPDSKTKLVSSKFGLADSINIVEIVNLNTQQTSSSIGRQIRNKFNSAIETNKGLKTKQQISKIFDTNSNDQNGSPNDMNIKFLKLAPIKSVETEISFSLYKTILSDYRC